MFPKYYVLEELSKTYSLEKNGEEIYLIALQHLLRSTGSLFESLIEMGIKPDHIFLTGKIYSMHEDSMNRIEQLNINLLRPTIPDKLGYYSSFIEKDVIHLWDRL